MNTIGIIAEYNPFHAGHKYHIEKTKELIGDSTVIAVMSGSFVQRGEPGIISKYKRAQMAVLCGVDLVIELPTIFACNEASQFAKGAVSLLDKLGVVDYISFGSETGCLNSLSKIARLLTEETDEFKHTMKDNLDKGLSYPKARELAIAHCLDADTAKIMSGSNNILAIEYIKQLYLLNSKILPVTIKRVGSAYNDESDLFFPLSAKSIRGKMTEIVDFTMFDKNIPAEIIQENNKFNRLRKCELNDFYDLFRYKVLNTSKGDLEEIYAAGEGLTNKLKDRIRYANSFDQLTEQIISKRYTRTRIQRLYIQILLGLNKNDYRELSKDGAEYARILAFNQKGAEIIKQIKKNELSTIPIITNINKEYSKLSESARKVIEYDILATDIYNIAQKNNLYDNSDYIKKPEKL